MKVRMRAGCPIQGEVIEAKAVRPGDYLWYTEGRSGERGRYVTQARVLRVETGSMTHIETVDWSTVKDPREGVKISRPSV